MFKYSESFLRWNLFYFKSTVEQKGFSGGWSYVFSYLFISYINMGTLHSLLRLPFLICKMGIILHTWGHIEKFNLIMNVEHLVDTWN